MKRLLIKNIAEFEAIKAYIEHNKELQERIVTNAFDHSFGRSFMEGHNIYFTLQEAYDQKYRILWSFNSEGCDPLQFKDFFQFKDFVEFFNQIPKKVFTFHDLEIGDVFVWTDEPNGNEKHIKINDKGFWLIGEGGGIVKGNSEFKGLDKNTEMEVKVIKTFKD